MLDSPKSRAIWAFCGPIFGNFPRRRPFPRLPPPRLPAIAILPRPFPRPSPTVIPAKAGIHRLANSLAVRNQAPSADSGSLLPSWEKARMRVSPRPSAALRARRPRSQCRQIYPLQARKLKSKRSRAPFGPALVRIRIYVIGGIFRISRRPSCDFRHNGKPRQDEYG